MTLKFNDELIINDTEWTYAPFRFDVDSITSTGETPPQSTSSKKVRLWATIREGNTSTGDAEGFITGQNDFSVQKGTLDNSRVRLFADNWEDIATIEFNYDNAPTAVAWTNITDDSYPTLTFTATGSKCTIDLSQIQDKSIIYNVYFTIDNGDFTLSNFKALDSNGKNIAGNFSTSDLYVPNGTSGVGYTAFDMQGYLHCIRQGQTASGTPSNGILIPITVNNSSNIKMHTEFTLEKVLGTSSSTQVRFLTLLDNNKSSYFHLRTESSAPNTLLFGYFPVDGSFTNVSVMTDFNSRVSHSFTVELTSGNGTITCTVIDNTTEETFTKTAEASLDVTNITQFAVMPTYTPTGSVTVDLQKTYCEIDGTKYNPITKVKKSDVDSKGLIQGSYTAVLEDGNDVTNGILDLSNTSTNPSYLSSIMSVGALFKTVNNYNHYGNNNSLVIRFKLPSSFITNDKRFWGLGNITTAPMYCNASVSTSASETFQFTGISSSTVSVSVNIAKETMYEYVFRNYGTKLYSLLYNVATGEILSRTSYTISSVSSVTFCQLILGRASQSENLQLLVDLNHTYTTKQGIINWTSSKLGIK